MAVYSYKLAQAALPLLAGAGREAYSRRKAANWTEKEAAGTAHTFTRGFTGHEHIDRFNLINMNGRMYDPVIGYFLSPDPYVQLPENTQGFNRYSYCLNNPLKYVDPSGEIITITDYSTHQSVVYFPYITTSSSSFIQMMASYLDNIYGTAVGMPVVMALMYSSGIYNVTDRASSTPGTFVFSPNGDGLKGGDLKMGGIESLDKMEGIGALAHELFHAYQQDKGQGGASVWNEVEAYLFEYVITIALRDKYLIHSVEDNYSKISFPYIPSVAYPLNFDEKGDLWSDSFEQLMYNSEFPIKSFYDAINSFQEGSRINRSGVYDNYKLLPIPGPYQPAPLIKNFYPFDRNVK